MLVSFITIVKKHVREFFMDAFWSGNVDMLHVHGEVVGLRVECAVELMVQFVSDAGNVQPFCGQHATICVLGSGREERTHRNDQRSCPS